jgi:hypothetical protein
MKTTKTISTIFKEHQYRRDKEVHYGEPCKAITEERTVTLTATLTLEYEPESLCQVYADHKFREIEERSNRQRFMDMRTAAAILHEIGFKAQCGPITRVNSEWEILSAIDTTELSEKAKHRDGLTREQAEKIHSEYLRRNREPRIC